MQQVVSYLISRLEMAPKKSTKVIPWSSPVPAFGDVSRSTIATVGINPSNREFVDDHDNELAGTQRRFHTLRSLGLQTWAQAGEIHHREIARACEEYFQTNPYDRWFRQLDFLISGTNFSYYSPMFSACHLDVVPFATACKWAELTAEHRSNLFAVTGDALGRLVRDSPLRVLVLNGSYVVSQFQKISGTMLAATLKPSWKLPRTEEAGVPGYAYHGSISVLAGIHLNREMTVLGFNHNIQSSFGVTRAVKASIRRWISKNVQEVLS
ncbi:hypothetical protein WMF27_27955 [Sorangium sp. So ce281]|uniref:hypothetical protein n=1 Tax=unclassified Sorangium TaxID=2621164 RepID=UPI003F636475